MSERPNPHAAIQVFEAELARLPADAPERSGYEITLNALRLQLAAAPVITSPISGQRDVNVATVQVFVSADERAEARAARNYAYIELLAEACGGLRRDERAGLPSERIGYVEQRAGALMRRWRHKDPTALLRRLRVELVRGITLWPPAGAAMDGALPLPLAYMVALLLWPMVGLSDPRLREDLAKAVAILFGEELAQLMDRLTLAWIEHSVDGERGELIFVLADELGGQQYRACLRQLCEYLCDKSVWIAGHNDMAVFAQARAALPTSPPLAGLASAQQPVAAPASAPRQRPNILVTEAGDLHIPISPAQWRFEVERRSTVWTPLSEEQGALAYWCFVRPPPQGSYRVGGWKPGDVVYELEAATGFHLARVPVTVAQYRQFVLEGYTGADRAPGWWTVYGRRWSQASLRRQPDTWQTAAFNHDAQPVTGICWYEAVAYTQWLNDLMADSLGNFEIRLPTEAEWELAAAYDRDGQRRRYPWGDTEPDASTVAWQSPFQEGPPVVGSRPRGAAACGALDLSGTVWECQMSSFRAYARESDQIRPDMLPEKEDVAWRGGAYSVTEPGLVSCAARIASKPDHAFALLGLRLVLAPLVRLDGSAL